MMIEVPWKKWHIGTDGDWSGRTQEFGTVRLDHRARLSIALSMAAAINAEEWLSLFVTSLPSGFKNCQHTAQKTGSAEGRYFRNPVILFSRLRWTVAWATVAYDFCLIACQSVQVWLVQRGHLGGVGTKCISLAWKGKYFLLMTSLCPRWNEGASFCACVCAVFPLIR